MKRTIATILLLVSAALLVARSRPAVATVAARVKARSDVYALPPARALTVLSFGYRAAVADYLWAHVLVTQGLRMNERRPFQYIVDYLDAINALDPKFREPYRLADSLLSFQVNDPNRQESIRQARRILERGLAQRPFDAELHLNYGQFLAYIAPGMLSDSKEREAWIQAGIKALTRAMDLGGQNEFVAWRSLPVATILSRQGEVDAAIRFLERAYSIAEDEEARADIAQRLEALTQGKARTRELRFTREFDEVWRKDLPFAPRMVMSVLGPSIDSAACAGPARDEARRKECLRDWNAWAETVLEPDGFEDAQQAR